NLNVHEMPETTGEPVLFIKQKATDSLEATSASMEDTTTTPASPSTIPLEDTAELSATEPSPSIDDNLNAQASKLTETKENTSTTTQHLTAIPSTPQDGIPEINVEQATPPIDTKDVQQDKAHGNDNETLHVDQQLQLPATLEDP